MPRTLKDVHDELLALVIGADQYLVPQLPKLKSLPKRDKTRMAIQGVLNATVEAFYFILVMCQMRDRLPGHADALIDGTVFEKDVYYRINRLKSKNIAPKEIDLYQVMCIRTYNNPCLIAMNLMQTDRDSSSQSAIDLAYFESLDSVVGDITGERPASRERSTHVQPVAPQPPKRSPISPVKTLLYCLKQQDHGDVENEDIHKKFPQAYSSAIQDVGFEQAKRALEKKIAAAEQEAKTRRASLS